MCITLQDLLIYDVCTPLMRLAVLQYAQVDVTWITRAAQAYVQCAVAEQRLCQVHAKVFDRQALRFWNRASKAHTHWQGCAVTRG